MAQDKVKVVVAFAPSGQEDRIGKTEEMTVDEARVAVAYGRVRYADGKQAARAEEAAGATPPAAAK